ncbi:MAG: sigma-70 family RNA polymerase sigma factor [Planctomycetota bacterium]
MTANNGHFGWITAALDRHGGDLARYALRFLHDHSRAQDVVQETFLRLCQQQQTELDGRLVPWLFAVCRNVALDVRRKEQKMSSLAEEGVVTVPSSQLSPPEQVEQTELAGQVLGLLARLPENQQEVIRLKFQHGMSYKEISGVTGLSVTNVGFLIHTGLKRLREWSRVA